jgi:hypothetical protein
LTDEQAAEARAELFPELNRSGLAVLLQDLRRRMTVARQEDASWNMRPAVRLTLFWNAATARSLAPAGQPWPAYVPRRCVLYLDGETFWPARLEWWGPAGRANDETALVQMELREPVLNQPLSPDQCEREFAPRPGAEKVPDQTTELARYVRAQASRGGSP